MIFNDSEFYPTRDGERSPYLKWQFRDTTDLNAIILLLKNLDYPFLADEWYQYIDSNKSNPLGRYISLMNLGNLKPLRFEDSKRLNATSRHLQRLFTNVDRTIYYAVAPEPKIRTEEIKSNTLKKPKYFIGYDEDNNPFIKFENVKDMNMSVDYDTTECRNGSGAIVGQWTLNKELKILFTCEEVMFGPIESQEEPKYIVKNGISIEVPEAKEIDYTKEVDRFIKELNL